MPSLGPAELVVILIIVLLLFGAKKLPELARSIGTSAKELRKSMKDDDSADKSKKSASDKQGSKKAQPISLGNGSEVEHAYIYGSCP